MGRFIVVGGRNNPDRPNMGLYLVRALQAMEHDIIVVGTKMVSSVRNGSWEPIQSIAQAPQTLDDINAVAEPYARSADGLYLMIPAMPPVELAYMQFSRQHDLYCSTIAKGALAEYWDELRPQLPMIGRYGTVGGRTLVLPWLKLQQLQDKEFIMYAYVNATVECFFHGTAGSRTPHEMYRVVKALSLAEPGSDDYVSCINIEIGGDYTRKIPILVNEALVGQSGPFMTPHHFDPYVDLQREDVLDIAARGKRFVVCISTVPGYMPLEVKRGDPGTLSAVCGRYQILGGFCDPERNVHLKGGWMKGGAKNGIKIIFQNGSNESGETEIVGEGAGPDTVWSAIINMNEYLQSRRKRPGHLGQYGGRIDLGALAGQH